MEKKIDEEKTTPIVTAEDALQQYKDEEIGYRAFLQKIGELGVPVQTANEMAFKAIAGLYESGEIDHQAFLKRLGEFGIAEAALVGSYPDLATLILMLEGTEQETREKISSLAKNRLIGEGCLPQEEVMASRSPEKSEAETLRERVERVEAMTAAQEIQILNLREELAELKGTMAK